MLVSYPKMRIEGTAVNLGDVHIMLPDCRIISIEELKKIERGGEIGAKAKRDRKGSGKEAATNVWMQWKVL